MEDFDLGLQFRALQAAIAHLQVVMETRNFARMHTDPVGNIALFGWIESSKRETAAR
jgi:hypothetical protein